MPRLYTEQPLQAEGEIVLENTASHHLANVLRARQGDPVTLFNGDGHDYAGSIRSTGKRSTIAIETCRFNNNESPFKIQLMQGVSRNDRMDYCLQKSVELGVTSIHAVFTQKSIVKVQKERLQKKLKHWQAVVISACEQSGRSVIPPILISTGLQEALSTMSHDSTDPVDTSKIVLQPGVGNSLAGEKITGNGCTLMIGPESGFTDTEIDMSNQAGFCAVTMGPRILRTESAAPAAISILQSLHGDMR